MDFVDWNNDDGNVKVSSYVWVYIVVTVVFTAITIGSWYFFVVHRRQASIVIDEEEAASSMLQPSHDKRNKIVRTTTIRARMKDILIC